MSFVTVSLVIVATRWSPVTDVNLLWFRLQPVPLAFLGWVCLEATFAAGQAK